MNVHGENQLRHDLRLPLLNGGNCLLITLGRLTHRPRSNPGLLGSEKYEIKLRQRIPTGRKAYGNRTGDVLSSPKHLGRPEIAGGHPLPTSITEPVNLDASGVFAEWIIRRTCGELDPGPGIFLHYQLMCRGRSVPVGFYPEYKDLTMDDLPHLIAVIEKIIHEWLGDLLTLRFGEFLDMETERALADAFEDTG